MLKEMGILGLGRLAFGLILFIGPGYGLLSFFTNRKTFDKTYTILLSFVLSACFWALLMVWLYPLGVRLSFIPVFAIALTGWIIGITRQIRSDNFRPFKAQFIGSIDRVLLWALLAGVTLIGLWAVRNQVVGSGSDSYHHTLITQLIMNQGRLLDNYQPVTDQIVTFTYHFGFHVTAAVMSWLSGLPTHWMVIVLGVLWIGIAALSTAFLTEAVTKSRWGGLVAALVTGLVCVFPTHMLGWGRYPQLTGLIIVAVFLGLFRQVLDTKITLRQAVFLGFLAAGMGTMHYRASLIAMVGAGTIILARWIDNRLSEPGWKVIFYNLARIGGVTLLLFLPWIMKVIMTRTAGYSLVVSTVTPSYYSLNRIGSFALNYPTNLLLLILVGFAAVWGVLRKDWRMTWLLLWTGGLIIFSQPIFAGVFMDFISVFISLFIPLSLAVGWLAAELAKRFDQAPYWLKWIGILFVTGVALWSTPIFVSNVSSGTAFVQPGDLEAMEWVRKNTSPADYFMVNLFHFDFSPDLIISLDAGYWLPLLAERKTVSLPMVYFSEKFREPEGIKALKELDALRGHLCSSDAEVLLVREGVTHVFIGSVGGPIPVNELLECPNFQLEFQHQSSYVFRFIPQNGIGLSQ